MIEITKFITKKNDNIFTLLIGAWALPYLHGGSLKLKLQSL